MADTADRSRISGMVLTGALGGLLCAWIARSRPPMSLNLADGWQVMQPVYVEPTPWWVYAVAAGLGAASGFVAARTTVLAAGRRLRLPPRRVGGPAQATRLDGQVSSFELSFI